MKTSSHQVSQYDISPLARAGVIVQNMAQERKPAEHDVFLPHRDRHYTLVVLIAGAVSFKLDFEDVQLNANTILLIAPGAVHQITDFTVPRGWVVEFDPVVVNEAMQYALNQAFGKVQSYPEGSIFFDQLKVLLTLMESIQSEPHGKKTLDHLLMACLQLLVSFQAVIAEPESRRESRPLIIQQLFEQLLTQHYRDWKQPSQYADALSVSVAHLNDTIKTRTGSPVSNHIQRRCVLEAKRLLFFTTLTVKEIGYELGYDEPVYFGKLFKKISSLTPLQFRQKYRG